VLGLEDKALAKKLAAFRKEQTKTVLKNPDPKKTAAAAAEKKTS